MDMDTYMDLLSLVTPEILKKDTGMRRAITPYERLTASLRFLATGRSYIDLEFTTAVSKQSLSCIVPETCKAIYSVLKKEYLKIILLAHGVSFVQEEEFNASGCIKFCCHPVATAPVTGGGFGVPYCIP
ncbi:hypothetical protein ILUMI_22426 [Ignelater luminosus]|uniref:Uncharacterized protein n=1 Tax=Ignelater luminosus TaxID=2038154 RepID=A0A8K0G0J5_IGNLU|nr:hypothetical protein ILUMI_22426 [Ignelater luminosus]